METPCAMVAFVLRRPGDLELQERELPVPADDESWSE